MDDQIEQAIERGDAQPWLDLIADYDKHYGPYNDACEKIEKLYASLSGLRNVSRDREFALFWSGIQTIAPSIYARPPIPSVTPRFRDRRPLYRTASEFLERAATTSFDLSDIDDTMHLLRDDLCIAGRGVMWIRYESEDGDKVCIDHVDRKDFGHTCARKWAEVDAVWNRSWMSKEEMVDRFGSDVVDTISFGGDTHRDYWKDGKCGVYEVWCKSKDRVYWVTEGAQKVLDESEPPIKLQRFFPCPKPAYGTVERGSLVPVPDFLQYKDQLEEVNDLTRRIHALSNSIRVRGFYEGGGDLGAAIERAILLEDDGKVMIPIPGLAALMQGSAGQPIIWLPVDMIAQVITGLVELRRQVIDDVYQITGLSDIMRGATEAQETLGAQQIKQQNGSIRVRDKQNELVRVALEGTQISLEIMAEEFDRDTLQDMAQMELPTDAEVKKDVAALKKSCEEELKALLDKAEEMADQAQGQIDPQQAEQQFQQQQMAIIEKYAPQIQKAGEQVTIDAVMKLLKDDKLRPFAIQIETDSTIYPDEIAEKANRNEFLLAFNSAMQTVAGAAQLGPEALQLAGGVFKFALAPYRVGRELEGMIDDLVDSAPQIAERMAQQVAGQQDEGLAEAQSKLAEAEIQKAQAQTAKVQADAALKSAELQQNQMDMEARRVDDQRKAGIEIARLESELEENRARTAEIEANTQLILSKIGIDAGKLELDTAKAAADVTSKRMQQEQQAIDSARNAEMGARQQDFTERNTQEERAFQAQQNKERGNAD